MKDIKVLISEKDIKKRITELSQMISKDYKNEEIVAICLLKGATYFAVDLTKKIKNTMIIDFMKISSYGNNFKSSGKVNILFDITTDIKNKNVLIIEDIVDSGLTLNKIKEYLSLKEPASIKTCVLLNKKERREYPFEPDYTGFEIGDYFIVGYGLDYNDKYRNLPYVGYIE